MHRPNTLSKLIFASLVVYVIGGVASIRLLGDAFIASYTPHPVALAIALVPSFFLAVLTVKSYRATGSLVSPTLSIIALPLFTLAITGFILVTLAGWVIVASLLLPQQNATLELKVLSVGRKESLRDVCHRYLELHHGSGVESLCADKLPLNGQLRAGDRVKLIGASSSLGFHIKRLEAFHGGV